MTAMFAIASSIDTATVAAAPNRGDEAVGLQRVLIDRAEFDRPRGASAKLAPVVDQDAASPVGGALNGISTSMRPVVP